MLPTREQIVSLLSKTPMFRTIIADTKSFIRLPTHVQSFIYLPSHFRSHQSAIQTNRPCRGSSIGRACGSYHPLIFQTSRSWVRAPPSAIPNIAIDYLFVCCVEYITLGGRDFFLALRRMIGLRRRVALSQDGCG